jgi:hypothetical protein
MNEPEKHYKSSAVFSIYAINKLKDGLGGWKIVSVSASSTNWKELPKMQFALPNNGSC